MRNLDESKIYYLGDLSEDERKCLYNITENHKILDTDWKYILFQLGRWVVGKSPREATNANELFFTLENVQVDCKNLSPSLEEKAIQIFQSNNIPWIIKTDFSLSFRHLSDRNYNLKTAITYEKFMDLFGERFPEVGQTKEENERNSNQVPDDSKLVSEREVPISIKIAETEREIILKKISEQDLEMIDKEQLTLLQEAEQIINGSRAEDYGSVTENFEKIAKGWEMIFSKGEFTPRNVANAMIWLKICRDTNTPKYDNPLDIAGYAGCIGKMINEDESKR